MLRITCNRRGITLIEVLITLFITAIGIMALLAMQPTSWNAAGRSDFMGRAAGILQSEFEEWEIWIMNPVNTVPNGRTRTVNASGQATQQTGDVPFTVATAIAPFGFSTNAWTVNVRVTWPGNNLGIAETMIVSRQDNFRTP
jgi:prepilin-type N-terminal cleavage/methylation domain-containing protein